MRISTIRRSRSKRGDGDRLAADILDAATDLLVETGDATAVSIRSVAERVGVTPPSIYLHFADKDALLTAVVSRYLAQLDVAMTEAAADAETPLHAARDQGLAFVRFALDTPELYRLAAMTPADSPSEVDTVLSTAAFAHLLQTVRELQRVGHYPAGDPLPIALHMLTVVHGIASLMVAKPFLPWGDRMDYADSAICSACLGFALTTRLPTTPGPDEVTRVLPRLRATLEE